MAEILNPQDAELEEVILGACLIGREAMPMVADRLRPEMFYFDKNALIYAAMQVMYREGRQIDIITVKNELVARGKLDAAGGPYELTRISGRVIIFCLKLNTRGGFFQSFAEVEAVAYVLRACDADQMLGVFAEAEQGRVRILSRCLRRSGGSFPFCLFTLRHYARQIAAGVQADDAAASRDVPDLAICQIPVILMDRPGVGVAGDKGLLCQIAHVVKAVIT